VLKLTNKKAMQRQKIQPQQHINHNSISRRKERPGHSEPTHQQKQKPQIQHCILRPSRSQPGERWIVIP